MVPGGSGKVDAVIVVGPGLMRGPDDATDKTPRSIVGDPHAPGFDRPNSQS